MKIVIFSGGTGSVAIQSGLHDVFGKEILDYSIITNLADNGLSTGECRKVMDGKIMGPSDLRKNQMLRARLSSSIDHDLYEFLDQRISMPANQVKEYLIHKINTLPIWENRKNILVTGVNGFFSASKALEIDYDDFSVSNIIYSGLAKENNYSLSKAGEIFEAVLNIPADAVVASSDEPMYLYATTASGHTILDEGDIVNWNNPNDKIVSCGYLNLNGQPVVPKMSEKSLELIRDADIIIFSTGTQWSSLIPTYISTGCYEAIATSKAKKYLVMNAVQDKDIKGVLGHELIATLSGYLPMADIKIVSADDGQPELSVFGDNVINADLCDSMFNSSKHDGEKLIRAIFGDYYSEYTKNDTIVFDYDDTLVARGKKEAATSKRNLFLLNAIKDSKNFYICTGNTINSISDDVQIPVFADGGINLYDSVRNKSNPKCLNVNYKFTQYEIDSIIKTIISCGINISKIQNRGDVMISIKPISDEYRDSICQLIASRFNTTILQIKPTGRTTIDITKYLDKTIILEDCFRDKRITFVGDEFYKGGNDHNISQLTDFLPVKSVKDTAMFLKILHKPYYD